MSSAPRNTRSTGIAVFSNWQYDGQDFPRLPLSSGQFEEDSAWLPGGLATVAVAAAAILVAGQLAVAVSTVHAHQDDLPVAAAPAIVEEAELPSATLPRFDLAVPLSALRPPWADEDVPLLSGQPDEDHPPDSLGLLRAKDTGDPVPQAVLLPGVADDQIPAGALLGQPDEDYPPEYLSRPRDAGQPNPLALPIWRFDEQEPAGAFFGQADDDFEWNALWGTPRPVWGTLWLALAQWTFDEQEPAGSLYGQPDEDVDHRDLLRPRAVGMPSPSALLPGLADDQIPAGSLVGVPEEQDWPPQLQRSVPSAAPLVALGIDDVLHQIVPPVGEFLTGVRIGVDDLLGTEAAIQDVLGVRIGVDNFLGIEATMQDVLGVRVEVRDLLSTEAMIIPR